MTSLRLITRQFSTSTALWKSSKSGKNVKIDLSQIETIVNPTDPKYLETFMEIHGKHRPDFQTDEIAQRRKAFGDNHKMIYFCLKDSYEIVSTLQLTKKASLIDKSKFIIHGGMAWVPEKYRGNKKIWLRLLQLQDQVIDMKHNNYSGATVVKMRKIYDLIAKAQGINPHTSVNYFISYYDFNKDIIDPNLKFDDIQLKKYDEIKDYSAVQKYDESVFPYERSKYIKMLFEHPENFSRIAYDSDGNVIGYGVVVVNPSGECVFNPIYANNERIAQAITQDILRQMKSDPRNEKYLKFQVRSNDGCDYSYKWFQPFVNIPLNRVPLTTVHLSVEPPLGVQFSKIVCNSHPLNCLA